MYRYFKVRKKIQEQTNENNRNTKEKKDCLCEAINYRLEVVI